MDNQTRQGPLRASKRAPRQHFKPQVNLSTCDGCKARFVPLRVDQVLCGICWTVRYLK